MLIYSLFLALLELSECFTINILRINLTNYSNFETKLRIMDLKKTLQVLGIIALSLFVIQLILGLVLSFAIGGFIFNAVDKIEDKIEIIDLSDVKVDIIDDEDSIHINSNSQKENNSKEKVLIIMGNDTIVNIQKNKKWIMDY